MCEAHIRVSSAMRRERATTCGSARQAAVSHLGAARAPVGLVRGVGQASHPAPQRVVHESRRSRASSVDLG